MASAPAWSSTDGSSGVREGSPGEIGHSPVTDDGRLCRCGNRGCLETELSSGALLALAIVVNAVNPEAVIVGGKVSCTGEPFLEGLPQALNRYARPGIHEYGNR